MNTNDELNYDFEKLRKKLLRREFLKFFLIGTPGQLGNTCNVDEATPEQLLRYAKRFGVNAERYKIKT